MTEGNIFIIEDEAVVAEFLQAKLQDEGYNVVGQARNADEAISFCKDHSVDVLLVDIKLEGDTDGIEAANTISEDNDCVIIYITAYSDSDLLDRAKETEPAGYLIKPIDNEEMICTLDIALYNRSLQQDRKIALEKRDKALKEKQQLLEEIKNLVERNSSIMAELLELQIGESDPALEGKRDEVMESLLDLQEKINDSTEDSSQDGTELTSSLSD